MTAPLRLFLDLGDLLTKGMAEQDGREKRLRFPSVVAHRLLDRQTQDAELLLDGSPQLTRLSGFDAQAYPRTRSYPKAAQVLASAEPVPGARFAGWLAAKLGADRQLLGTQPTAELVDALVRKALMQLDRAGLRCGRVQLVLVVDAGAKTDALLSYAAAPRVLTWTAHGIRSREPRRIEVELCFEILDAPGCAAAALPAELALEPGGDLLLIDVGYLRCKLAVLTANGCALQEQLRELGVADCVRRLLRDEQEHGLIEDELAVAIALERSQDAIDVAARRFEIARTLASAKRAVVEELCSAAKRIALAHYAARGTPCKALAVIGGGSALFGRELVSGLRALELGIERTWVTKDPSFTLLTGAKRLCS
jgi:hypothetical protein